MGSSEKSIITPDPEIVLFTDSSKEGWGGVIDDQSTGGQWDETERHYHINYLELKAVLLALQSFCKNITNTHIRIRSDNTVTVICINKQGSTKHDLNDITRQIWLFAIERNIVSRVFFKNLDTEWMLNKQVFQMICKMFGTPDIDLFANRLNCQVQRYFSYKEDPHTEGIDAFLQSWSKTFNYLFPPFSCIGQVLQNIQQEEAEAIILCPTWTTQVFFPQLLKMCITCPFFLPMRDDLLTLPGNVYPHPLLKKLRLAVFRISGKCSKAKEYQMMLRKSSCIHGEIQQSNNIGAFSKDGCVFVVKGTVIPFHQM